MPAIQAFEMLEGKSSHFIDDDETAGEGWLENLTANLHAGEWAGAGGRVLPPPGSSLPNWLSTGSWFIKGPLASFDLGIPAGEMDEPPFGANMAFRKEVFEKYGGFRTDLGRSGNNLISNEDTEFGRRLFSAGLRLRYEPGQLPITRSRRTGFGRNIFLAGGSTKEDPMSGNFAALPER